MRATFALLASYRRQHRKDRRRGKGNAAGGRTGRGLTKAAKVTLAPGDIPDHYTDGINDAMNVRQSNSTVTTDYQRNSKSKSAKPSELAGHSRRREKVRRHPVPKPTTLPYLLWAHEVRRGRYPRVVSCALGGGVLCCARDVNLTRLPVACDRGLFFENHGRRVDLQHLGITRSQVQAVPGTEGCWPRASAHCRGEFIEALKKFDESKQSDAAPSGRRASAWPGWRRFPRDGRRRTKNVRGSIERTNADPRKGLRRLRASTEGNESDGHRSALLDARAYSEGSRQTEPRDANYRVNFGFIYGELGDTAKPKRIMDELAPRYRHGFAKAHLLAGRSITLADRPLTDEVLDAAEAHLMRLWEPIRNRLRFIGGSARCITFIPALQRTEIDPRFRHARSTWPRRKQHLSQIHESRSKVATTWAEIQALSNKPDKPRTDVNALAGSWSRT